MTSSRRNNDDDDEEEEEEEEEEEDSGGQEGKIVMAIGMVRVFVFDSRQKSSVDAVSGVVQFVVKLARGGSFVAVILLCEQPTRKTRTFGAKIRPPSRVSKND